MPETVRHLIDLDRVKKRDLDHVIVSQHRDIVISRYGDETWNLAPYLPARNSTQKRIKFTMQFKSGYRLTDPEYATLLASAKRFLYTRWRVAGGQLGRPVSARTLTSIWSQLRRLLEWMIEEGLTSFSELTPDQCARYASSLGDHLQPGTITQLLGVVTSYYEMRDHLIDRMPDFPWQHQFGAPTGLARNGRRPRGESWKHATTEVIPLRIMSALVQKALDYVEVRAGPLLDLRDQIAKDAEHKLSDVKLVHRKKYPSGFSSVHASEQEYLRVKASHRWTSAERRYLIEHGYESRRQLQFDLVHLRTACYIICAAFSGMRDSELASLEVGCFVKRKGFDGETFCWLKGITYKLERDPKPAEWMVPEIVGKAVSVATRLGAPERALSAERIKLLERTTRNRNLDDESRLAIRIELEQARRHQNALLLVSKQHGKISALGSNAARTTLHAFARQAGLKVEQQDLDGVLKRERVQQGETWPFSPHQFRRTFAVYVARHVLGDVRYLREHFKHWSLDMTLYYAKHESGVDRSLVGDIITERDDLQSLLVESWMHPNSTLSGKGGRRIMAFRSRGEVKTVHDMRDFCRKLGENVFIRGTGHSWCMASGNGCGGQGLYDAVRCTSCGEAVIDSTHAAVWQGIRQQQIDVLQCPDLGIPSKQRCIDHLRKAETVLADLGIAGTPFPLPRGESHAK